MYISESLDSDQHGSGKQVGTGVRGSEGAPLGSGELFPKQTARKSDFVNDDREELFLLSSFFRTQRIKTPPAPKNLNK